MNALNNTKSNTQSNTELAYQTQLLGAIWNVLPPDVHANWQQGLVVYQRNARANAIRALGILHPAVLAVLGEADFAAVATGYYLANPPYHGDWGQYVAKQGFSLGDWLAASNYGGVHTALPFLADLARLDDALSTAQDASDGNLDAHSLNLLVEQAGQNIRLVLQPCVGLLVLKVNYEVNFLIDFRNCLLKTVHVSKATSMEAISMEAISMVSPIQILIEDFMRVIANLETLNFNALNPVQQEQSILVYRPDWQAKAQSLKPAGAQCIQLCLAGATIEQAVRAAQAIDATFDFATWLTQLLAWQAVHQVVCCDEV